MPEIRFKGFVGDWRECEYSKTFTNISNNTLSRAELNYNFGLAKNIHYGDVLIKFGELLNIEKEEIPFITNNTLVNKFKSSSKLQNGDVIIADAAEDKTVGKCTELINVGEEIIFSGLHTITIRPILSFASKYLGYYMNSPAYHNQLLPLMQGTKVLSISKSAIQNTTISSPTHSLEQTKIGNYFQQLDTLIILHQQKYDKLLNIKKAMLEKMFPKNGVDVPEIRFKGFSGEWEKRELGGISTYIKGFAFKSVDYKTAGIRIIRVSDLSKDSVSESIDKIYLNNNKKKQFLNYIINYGDIVITTVGSKAELKESAVGRPIIFTKNKGYILNQNLVKITPIPNYDSQFIYNQLINEKYAKYIEDIQRGNANQANITINDLWKYSLQCPDFVEQTKIGNLFKSLDNLLTLHQTKLAKLKNIKKACLEKMFV